MNEFVYLYILCVAFMIGAMYSKSPRGFASLGWLFMVLIAPLSIFAYLGSRLERISRK